MLLPERCPFTLQMLYNDDSFEDPAFEEFKKQYDTQYELRKKCRLIFYNEVLRQFFPLYMKYLVLKEVVKEKGQVKDVLLLNISEDALRQNVCDLAEQIKSFIELINQFSAQFSILFKKGSQKTLFKVTYEGSSRKEEIAKLNNAIDNAREHIFRQFSAQGGVHDISWYMLRNYLTELNEAIREYRDTVGSHISKEKVKLTIEACDVKLLAFKELLLDFNTVLFWEKKLAIPTGLHMSVDFTTSFLNKAIWK